MIYTLTLNPCLDYSFSIKDAHSAEVIRTRNETFSAGGKGINVSVVLNRLGAETVALGLVGGFTGAEIKRKLKEEGVVCAFTRISDLSRLNVKAIGETETQYNGAGPKVSEREFDRLLKSLDRLNGGDYLVLAGSVPPSLKGDTYAVIMSRLAGKNVNFVVDATGETLKASLRFRPFLIKPNDLELGLYFGAEIESVDDVYFYAEKLIAMGARNVLVSLGSRGAAMVDERGERYYTAAPEGKVCGTVGAGDSSVAGFLYEYSLSRDTKAAFYRAVATGSATAFSEGLATKAASDELFARLYPKSL